MGAVYYNNKRYVDSATDSFVGSIVPAVTEIAGWLECNGEEFDIEKYPTLYQVLGSDKLPDFREAVPVGIGQNPNTTRHLSLELNTFQDSMIQSHTHTHQAETTVRTYEYYAGSGIKSLKPNLMTNTLSTSGTGPSKGKRKGVRYYIYPGQ